ncbi:putative bifunctional diguanylate cyclase/phosphodiesterase [Nitrincola iocasae]|uniref:EAL domain-containing protein n=1 Tax=Nitrincola iocasae TaxID=2614693 RepID=A0A5J6LGB9_9GAMM|nr:bifunctional diguanylate cyclase/phosphodiesterase [Nitrincola iocasae]QEW07406.1 EAL domain-containing protein [Nitrincola iocasae]
MIYTDERLARTPQQLQLLKQQGYILDAANEMIITVSLDERLLFLNQSGRHLLGVSLERDLTSEPLYVADLHSPKVYEFLREHVFPALLKDTTCWKGDIEFRDLNHQPIPVYLTVISHLDSDGKVASITGLAKDLREQNALEIQQRLAKRVFDNTIEGIFVTDASARIFQVNPAFTEITGYSPEEVLGKTPRLLRSNHHDAAFYEKLWAEVALNGSWQGEIWNRRKDGSVYLQWLSINCLKNSQDETEYYVAVFHDLSELRAREAEIEYLVNHDPLTGLGNRSQFRDRIEQGIRSGFGSHTKMAVIKIDLGEIQLINDSLGHACSDRLIKQAGDRLKELISRRDSLVRLGADEFGLVVADVRQMLDISQMAFDLKLQLQAPFILGGETLYMNPSIGISFYPDDADNVEDLLRCARTALQEAKAAGRNTFCFYNQDMSHQARDRLVLEQALREAVLGNALSLNFQPKVLLETGEVFAVEVLVRWRHPVLGFISPAVFIPIAERSGLIAELGNWVMQETCRQLEMMKCSGLKVLPVAINLSVYELERPGFAKHLMDPVKKFGLDPGLFEFEVTETGLMSREEAVIDALKQLREAGFNVALDDFGTGYSSLSYLRKLPLSTLKIDRAFVIDMTNDKVAASIVRTVIALAESLELEVIAEGVETLEQQTMLLNLGCKKAQGYLFYKPLSLEDFYQLLAESG